MTETTYHVGVDGGERGPRTSPGQPSYYRWSRGEEEAAGKETEEAASQEGERTREGMFLSPHSPNSTTYNPHGSP